MCYFYWGLTSHLFTILLTSDQYFFFLAEKSRMQNFSRSHRLTSSKADSTETTNLVAIMWNLTSPNWSDKVNSTCTWVFVKSQRTNVPGALLAQRIWRAASQSTCAAYCKGSPTVQIFHLSTVWLGYIPHTDIHKHTNTKEGTQVCTTDGQISKKLHSITSPHPKPTQSCSRTHISFMLHTHTQYKCIINNIIIGIIIIITSATRVGQESLSIITVVVSLFYVVWLGCSHRKTRIYKEIK